MSSVRSSFTSLIGSSTRVKLPHDDHSLPYGGKTEHISEGRGGFKMKDLESGDYRHKAVKSGQVEEDSQIHLTQDISVTQEQLDDPSLRPVANPSHV